jgi:DNA helicase-2/ATP-dependent DNA helicase PcrA
MSEVILNAGDLTDEQLKVVECDHKIVLCAACPGSGKTTTLRARALRLWETYQQPLLIVTFSNKAADDVRKKIDSSLLNVIQVKTIHKLALDLIKDYWQVLGSLVGGSEWPGEPEVAVKQRELTLIQEFDPRANYLRRYELLSKMRAFGIQPGQLISLIRRGVYFAAVTEEELNWWRSYESFRLSRGLLTFDDMVYWATRLLTYPEVSTRYVRRWSHLLVDEAQDTSPDQWELLRPLITNCESTLVVYDHNQAIYGWRGGDAQELHGMALLCDAVSFRITQSFRSGKRISSFANGLCPDKRSVIRPVRETQGAVQYMAFDTPEKEVQWVLSTCDAGSAILARTNSYLEAFERQLIERNQPYQGVGFYRSRAVVAMVREIQELTTGVELSEDAIVRVLSKTFVDNLQYDRIERQEFARALRVAKTEGTSTLLRLVEDAKRLESKGVTLATGHSSKGLQWPTVHIVGCHDGLVPHRLSADLEEERRLMYVMATRAEDLMTISWVGGRSRFLTEEALAGAH